MEIRAITNMYWDEVRQNEQTKEKARKKYYESVKEIRAEYKKQLRVAKTKKQKVESELRNAQEKLKTLQKAEIKQHNVPDVDPDIDLRNRETSGHVLGVLKKVGEFNDLIKKIR